MVTVIILTLNDYAVSIYLDLLCIRDNWKSKMLSDLRTNLSCITIDSLTACDDQIIVKLSDRTSDCCRCCPGISTTKYTVCYKNTLVSAHSDCFLKNICSLWKSHCKNCNLSAILILQSKSCLKTSLIIWVHNCEHCSSIQCTIWVELYATLCIRYLLNTYDNFHDKYLLTLTSLLR